LAKELGGMWDEKKNGSSFGGASISCLQKENKSPELEKLRRPKEVVPKRKVVPSKKG